MKLLITMIIIVLVTTKEKSLGTNFNQQNWISAHETATDNAKGTWVYVELPASPHI